MTKRTFIILFLAAPALAIALPVLASVGIGEITYRYFIKTCEVLDPPAGAEFELDLEINDEVTHVQFVTNTCDNTIRVEIELDEPNVEFIDVRGTNIGIHSLSSGETVKAEAHVTIANNAPVGLTPPLTFEITRPE